MFGDGASADVLSQVIVPYQGKADMRAGDNFLCLIGQDLEGNGVTDILCESNKMSVDLRIFVTDFRCFVFGDIDDSLVTTINVKGGERRLMSLHVSFAGHNVGSHLGRVLKGLLNLASGNMEEVVLVLLVFDAAGDDKPRSSLNGGCGGVVIRGRCGVRSVFGIGFKDSFKGCGCSAHGADVPFSDNVRTVQVTAFIVNVGEIEFKDLEIMAAGFRRRSRYLILLDVGSGDRFGFGRCRIRYFGDGLGRRTVTVVTEFVERGLDDTGVEIGKGSVPVLLFQKFEIKDLGIPLTGSGHEDVRKGTPFFIGERHHLEIYESSTDTERKDVAILLETL